MRSYRRSALLLAAALVAPAAAHAQFHFPTPGGSYFQQFLIHPTSKDYVLTYNGGWGFLQIMGGTGYLSILAPDRVGSYLSVLTILGYQIYDNDPFAPPTDNDPAVFQEDYQGGYEGEPNDPPGVTTTPEPSTFILLGTGMAGILAMGARRRRKNRLPAE